MAKDYEDKIEDILEKEEIESSEMEVEVDEEMDMEHLAGVIKSEMDDAKDFIHQVGAERAESTEYYLGNEPEGTSSMQSEYVSTDVRDSVLFMLPSIMRTFFGTKRLLNSYRTALKTLLSQSNKLITSTTSSKKRIKVSKFYTVRLKMRWLEKLVLLKSFGMTLSQQPLTNTQA